jgi:hypothetical protein
MERAKDGKSLSFESRRRSSLNGASLSADVVVESMRRAVRAPRI